jgi:hypothetical protein
MSLRLLHALRLLATVLGLTAAVVGWYAVRSATSQHGRPSHSRAHATGVAGAAAARSATAHGSAAAAKVAPTGTFTLSGQVVGTLFPGSPALPVELVIENPAAAPLTVEAVTTTVAGTSRDICGASNFLVARQLAAPVVVPGRATRSLSQLGIPRSRWPQLRMLETGANQDDCAAAAVTLSFHGTGRYGR